MRTMAMIAIACMMGAAGCVGESGSTGEGGKAATGAASVNGCDPKAAADHSSEDPMMVMFGDSLGDSYSPKCAKIKAGGGVQFMGDLAAHPLAGGMHGEVDTASPIKETKAGSEITFDNLPAGAYGYFCETHHEAGMIGAVFVE